LGTPHQISDAVKQGIDSIRKKPSGGQVMKLRSIFLATLIAIPLALGAQQDAPLKLLHTTPLPGFQGDLDHSAVDLKGHRLFVTAEVHKTVEVFDLNTGERIHSITGFDTPHEILFRPDSNTLIVADGGSPGSCKLVDGKTYEIIDKIELPPYVDSAEYNPVTKEYYVESRGPDPAANTHTISIIDAVHFKHTGDFTLPGRRSEAMAIDRAGKMMYVNLTDEIGVVDLAARKLIDRWPVPDAHVQNSMALDEPHHRLFIATRNPAKLFIFNTETGKVVLSVPCVGVNDDMTFDSKRKRIYITGDGATSVFDQQDSDHYEHLVDVPTGFRAKTSLYVPELNRLYINVAGGEKRDAPVGLQIYQVLP
jgi:DNA-binding beta-propeller fold protein YncE